MDDSFLGTQDNTDNNNGPSAMTGVKHEIVGNPDTGNAQELTDERIRVLAQAYAERSKNEKYSEDFLIKLGELWRAGDSGTEIAKKLGLEGDSKDGGKSMVIGLKNRMGLPDRPSPINRNGETTTRPRRTPQRNGVSHPRGPTIPPLESSAQPVTAATTVSQSSFPTALPPPATPKNSFPRGQEATCCWPIGEPGTKTFRYCDDVTEPKKPYCAEHAKLGSAKIKARRADADAFVPR